MHINPDAYGFFTANQLTVEDGAKLKATLAHGLVDKATGAKEYQLVSGQEGWEDNFMLAQDNNMYKFEKTDVAGEYLVLLAQTAGEVAQNNGGTANNINTAGAWGDGGTFAKGTAAKELADQLAGLAQHDASAFNNALTDLAPEVSPVVRTQAVEHSNQIFSAVSSRLSSGAVSSALEGKASGDSLLEGGATWVQMLANKAEFDGNSKAHGFDSKSAGVAMGAEKQVTDEFKAGVGYGYTNGEIDAFMRDIDVATHTGFVYGEYKPGNWFVNGIASYSFADYDERKNVAGRSYKADYDTENFSLQVMSGYDTAWGDVSLTPSVGLRYNHIRRDGYTDGIGQRVSGDRMDVLTAVAGAKISKDFQSDGGTWWRPEANLDLAYDLVSDAESAVVGVSNGSSYLVEGERLDRLSVEAGLGVTVDVNEHVELNAGYEGRFRQDYQNHTGSLNAKYKF